MTAHRNPDAAVQYLVWALEEIEKFGHTKAALHARIALDELRGVCTAGRYAEEAKRFRNKADEAEQLAELAATEPRRDALMKIVESYRRTADQMDRLSETRQ
jgi:hypothetical protein